MILQLHYSDETAIFNVNMETHLGCLETVLLGNSRNWAYKEGEQMFLLIAQGDDSGLES